MPYRRNRRNLRITSGRPGSDRFTLHKKRQLCDTQGWQRSKEHKQDTLRHDIRRGSVCRTSCGFRPADRGSCRYRRAPQMPRICRSADPERIESVRTVYNEQFKDTCHGSCRRGLPHICGRSSQHREGCPCDNRLKNAVCGCLQHGRDAAGAQGHRRRHTPCPGRCIGKPYRIQVRQKIGRSDTMQTCK